MERMKDLKRKMSQDLDLDLGLVVGGKKIMKNCYRGCRFFEGKGEV